MAGDPGAVYQQLYADHAGAVLAYLNNELRDPDVAEDVSQDAWLKVHRFLPGVLAAGGDGGKPWLMRIATNAAIDHWRQVKARPQTDDLDDVLTSGGAVPAGLLDGETPEGASLAEVEHDTQRAQAALLLELVSADVRRLLWLREWRGLTYREIAQALSRPVTRWEEGPRGKPVRRYRQETVTVAAVKARLRRARQTQRDWWAFEETQRDRQWDIATRIWGFLPGVRPDDHQPCWRWHGFQRTVPPRAVILRLFPAPNRPADRDVTRLLYAVQRGPLPPWAVLRRTCANGYACVNPWHTVVVARYGQKALALAGDTPAAKSRRGATLRPLDPASDTSTAPSTSGSHTDRQTEGERTRAKRLAHGLTTHDVGVASGIAYTVIARWEKGSQVLPSSRRVILEAVDRLCRGCSPVGDGATVRRRRQALGLTLLGLSRLVPIQENTLRSLEVGRLNTYPYNRRRVADALDRLEREQQEAMA